MSMFMSMFMSMSMCMCMSMSMHMNMWQACEMCHCHSEFEGDSIKAECQGWCSLAQWKSHCNHCKCSGCDFCLHGASCRPSGPDDVDVEKCEDFCNKAYAADHCRRHI